MSSNGMLRESSKDTRVEDYLDDKLQSPGDLDTLDALLENVISQQKLLKQQLEDARRDSQDAQDQAMRQTARVQGTARQFQEEQGDIDRRLMIVTQSETSDEAVQRFKASMDVLWKIDVARGYAETLKEVEALHNVCASQLGKSDRAALEPYRQLQNLATNLRSLQDAAEGAGPQLLHHVATTAATLRRQIQTSFSADFERTLKRLHWPKSDISVPPGLRHEFDHNVRRLLDLQRPELEAYNSDTSLQHKNKEPVVLLPLEVLVHPLSLRFDYHFAGDRPTNRLDKPEYFLNHITDLLNTYGSFVEDSLQPELLCYFRDSELSFNPCYIDATSAFVTALLPMLRRKLSSTLPKISLQSNLFSHLMHEVMTFDTTLRETWNYAGSDLDSEWRGLAYYVLDRLDYFPRWIKVERDFALERYESIISSPDSGDLDHDSVAVSATKPTKAAIRVNDLLETITDRYRPLESFSQKLRFLIDIQISIFDLFHTRLHESLQAYLTMTSSIARTVQGISKEEQADLQGVKGLDRLCRVFGSAEYLERAMRDWSDDVFFLELWEELQNRAQSRSDGRNLAGPLSAQEIAKKTSSTIYPANSLDEDGDEIIQGALFDETAAAYQRLRIRSEALISETLTYNIRESLRPYSRINPWASLSSSSASSDAVSLALTAELDPTIRLLSDYLGFLSRALAKAPLRRIVRQLCSSMQSSIWDNVLMRHSFSTAGAAQLTVDIGGLCETIDRYVGDDVARSGMRKLVEGVTFLSLPVRGEITRDEQGTGSAQDNNRGASPRRLGLFDAERRVFMNNENARDVLEELGMEVLSESEARHVLERRVELGS
ncbi:hypothetical protein LTR66_002925 [Elasticomyces elasticus]|nr:hypothetical protein LTR66_002925 [Elasticomyces elasticus]